MLLTNSSTDDVGRFCRCEAPLALENLTFKTSLTKKDTKKRLSKTVLRRVVDKLFDLGCELADDNGLSFAHSYSIVRDGDLDVSGL